MNKRKIKLRKLNNSGSSLVSVIIAVLFISILATVLLYISGSNYRIKNNDKNNKESFYETETAAEQIKAELSLECAKAAETAYMEIIVKYNVNSATKRYEIYRDAYFAKLKDIWENELLSEYGVSSYIDALRAMVDTGATIEFDPPHTGTLEYDLATDPNHAFIRGIRITYESDNGYVSEILTDMVFTTPFMNWGIDESYTSVNTDLEDKVDSRFDYDISECVNYANWVKQ